MIRDNDILLGLWNYWQAKRAARPMPRRCDFDPMDIPSLLPHLILVERTEEGRYRYRLAGTAVVETYGMELTGRHADEIFPPPRYAVAKRHYALGYDPARPFMAMTRYSNSHGIELLATRLILPLATEHGDAVQVLLLGQTCSYAPVSPSSLGPGSAVSLDGDEVQFLDATRPVAC